MTTNAEQALTAVARSLGDVLPDGFRRCGRKWVRVTHGVQQEIHLRRLRFSYGLGVVMFRLSFLCGPEGHRLSGGDWFTEHADWRIAEDTDDPRLTEIIAEVHEDLIEIVDFFTTTASPTGYLEWAGHRLRALDVLWAYIAFDMRDEALRLMASSELTPHMDSRELNLEYGHAVLEACELFDVEPDERWRQFASRSVKVFRGRPPKKVREPYDRVVELLHAFEG